MLLGDVIIRCRCRGNLDVDEDVILRCRGNWDVDVEVT